jgi:uncharacterized alpha-E superfamily protein
MALFEHVNLPMIAGASHQDQVHALLSSPKSAGNIPSLVGKLVFNAAAARDRLSDDIWRLINRIQRDSKFNRDRLIVATALEGLDTLILDMAAFSGMQLESTTRGHGWRFLEIGRRIERTQLSALLIAGATSRAQGNSSPLESLLEVCDSTMTFRRLHFAQPTLEPALDLLILNPNNPRSIAFQLAALRAQVEQLPHSGAISPKHELALTDEMDQLLHSINLRELSRTQQNTVTSVQRLSKTLDSKLDELSNRITEHYFSLATRRIE